MQGEREPNFEREQEGADGSRALSSGPESNDKAKPQKRPKKKAKHPAGAGM